MFNRLRRFAQELKGQLLIKALGGQSFAILLLKTAQGQTGNVLEVDSPTGSGGDLMKINKNGSIYIGTNDSDTVGGLSVLSASNNRGFNFIPSFGGVPFLQMVGDGQWGQNSSAVLSLTSSGTWSFRTGAATNSISFIGNSSGVGSIRTSQGNTGAVVRLGGTIIDHFTDAGSVGTTETDLYSDSILANTFVTNGDKVKAEYGVLLTNSTSSKRLRLYFAGTVIWDSGTLTTNAAGQISLYMTLTRVSATVIRYNVSASAGGLSVTSIAPAVGELTGLTLTNANILKITGLASNVVGSDAANNDVLAKMSIVDYFAAA